MKVRLGDISEIFYGPHKKAEMKGEIKYLTASHFNHFFEPIRFKESYINSFHDAKKYLLNQNDLIITGKGHRIFSWAYKKEYGAVIPSSLFYIIKIDDSKNIMSEYLTNYLNSEKINHILQNLSRGTSIPSIQKKELERLEVIIPPLERQKEIIEFAKLMDRDVDLAKQLLEKKKTLRKEILNRLLKNTK